MELKKTLLMPRTGFEMRGDLRRKEPLLVRRWKEDDIYDKLLEWRKDAPEYSFHDGPPYANGDIHAGHMLNRLLKDFVVRSKIMSGFRVPFVFGFDTHGLPIENKLIRKGVDRKKTPIVEFRKKCAEYARGQIARQKEQIRRLGVIGDFEHPYLTLDKEFEADQIRCFAEMALKGLIYKGLKPVYWSPSSESALAEAEIVYQDVESHSIYVAFEVADGKGVVPAGAKALIWTTTPWTLPANLAISVHPRHVYGLYKTDKGDLIFLADLKDKLTEALGLTECAELKTFKGSELEGVETKHPFYERLSPIILGEHVSEAEGTGLVHTAPGHGLEDYVVGLKYHLKPYCPVDARGRFDDSVGPDLAGLFYEDANAVVLKKLEDAGALLRHEIITHSYPHDWRTKKPLIFRATPQWFCSIEKIRDDLIREVKKVRWLPAWGELRMMNMVKDRADWCISRQRAWGVPLPIIYNEDGSPIIEKAVFAHVADLFEKYGSNVWYEREPKDLLPPGYTNPKSPHGLFTKERDIMDVWFDSGSSFDAVMRKRGRKFPCDLYLEGNDQYRGWFNASLTISTACYGTSPYLNCVSHGWVLAEDKAKMSKSAGNGLDPTVLCDRYGADVLRLWVASVDYRQDVRLSERLLAQVGEQYRKIRNTLKFMLGNLSDGELGAFDPKKDVADRYEVVDQFILATLEKLVNDVRKDYENFDFASALSEIMNFLTNDLSSFYLDIAKDVLYCSARDDKRRRQIQSVIYRCCSSIVRLLTPILPFTMEEASERLPGSDPRGAMFHDFPEAKHNYGPGVLRDYALFKSYREKVLKALEIARAAGTIGSAQEASVTLPAEAILEKTGLDKDLKELARLFIVSEATIDKDVKEPVAVRCGGEKCPRCWNYVKELVEVDGETRVCPRCAAVLKGLFHE